MPNFEGVVKYLADHDLEAELSELVSKCVEDETPQPLVKIAAELAERAQARAVAFDYPALVDELTKIIRGEGCGWAFVRLSWHDAAVFSPAHGGGGPNAALRFSEAGEGSHPPSKALAAVALPLLQPLKAKHPAISHADMWALAANVAIEVMGGPKVRTRFGRTDAASSADGVDDVTARLPHAGMEAKQLRACFGPKGFADKDIVALCGAHVVSVSTADVSPKFTSKYFAALLSTPPAGTRGAAVEQALMGDAALKAWVGKYAADESKWFADFAAAWARAQELGFRGPLRPHPQVPGDSLSNHTRRATRPSTAHQ